MTTKETVERYFGALRQKQGWETLLADNMAFTSYVSPVKQVNGRDAYLQATKRFFSMIVSVDVRELIVEGDRACARTHYALQPPNAYTFSGYAIMAPVPLPYYERLWTCSTRHVSWWKDRPKGMR